MEGIPDEEELNESDPKKQKTTPGGDVTTAPMGGAPGYPPPAAYVPPAYPPMAYAPPYEEILRFSAFHEVKMFFLFTR